MLKHRRVLFVGQNPARKELEGQRAFLGTQSGNTLEGWIYLADIPFHKCDFVNAYERSGTAPKTLTIRELSSLEFVCSHYFTIVAVGKYAARQLKEIMMMGGLNPEKVCFIEHPSGLNRNLNNPETIKKQIKTIKEHYESRRNKIASWSKEGIQLFGESSRARDLQRKKSKPNVSRKENRQRSSARKGSSVQAGAVSRKGN